MQSKQRTLIAPVEALMQQVADSVSTMPDAIVVNTVFDDTVEANSTLKTVTHEPSNNNDGELLVGRSPLSNDDAISNLSSAFDGFDNLDNASGNDRDSINSQRASIFLHRQGFRLNNYNLMVRFEDGNQISEVPSIYPLPNAPRWFLGMSNINGQTIPVFNLKEYFGITNYDQDSQRIKVNKITTDKKTPMLFVIQQGDNATGIIIDGLLERLDIDDSKIQPNINLPNKLKNCTHHTYLLNKELWYDLNCLDFLDEIEKQIAS